MERDRFLALVKTRAGLATQNEAEATTRAVLETLAERMAGNEPANAAAQLPRGLAQYLQHEGAGAGIDYSLDEFFEKVSDREGIDKSHSADRARAVITVLQEAISKGEIDDIKAQLPPEFDSLFQGNS